MATRSSARLAVPSPPPSNLSSSKGAFSSESRSNTTVLSMAWTQNQLDEYRLQVVDTSELSSLLPVETTDESGTFYSAGIWGADGVDLVAAPEGLFSSEDSSEADFLIRAFFDTLGMIRRLVVDGEEETRGVEGFTRQLLFDFMRILVLANKEGLRKSANANVQMMYNSILGRKLNGSPPGQRTFDVGDTRYIVANDGSFGVLSNDDKKRRIVKNLPISFEVCAFLANGS
jgi:hypothetical protein